MRAVPICRGTGWDCRRRRQGRLRPSREVTALQILYINSDGLEEVANFLTDVFRQALFVVTKDPFKLQDFRHAHIFKNQSGGGTWVEKLTLETSRA